MYPDLLCRRCPQRWTPSDEDPVAVYDDVRTHMRTRHGIHDWQAALQMVTEVPR